VSRALVIIGVNHETAPVAVRERLAFDESEVVSALLRAREQVPLFSEAALLSTCNRVEMIAVAENEDETASSVISFLARDRGVEPALFESAIYRLDGQEAARHLFRVGASLDSMIVGEPQILGQLKLAYTQAAEAGTIGMILHRAFHKAFSVAKQVRRQTLIGHGSVSVSSAAVALAKQIFDSLHDKTVMLLGAGKMAELAARSLAELGVESVLITNRTFDRAVALARDLGGTAVPFDNFKPYLKIADIVIGSVASTRPVLSQSEIEVILRERKYRPMFLIDLGVPRNFDERLNQVANVYLYDIDDLGAVVLDSLGDRESEAQKAQVIVELEVEAFWHWFSGLELVPAIKEIRANVERLRELELDRHRGWLEALPSDQRTRVESLTRGIVNKILHQVMTELRRGNGAIDGLYATEIARRLLGEAVAAAGVQDPESEDNED